MRRTLLVAGVVGGMLVAPLGVFAEPFDLQAPPPAPSRPDRPAPRRDATTVRPPLTRHRPGPPETLGFVGPLTTRTETGRAGAAGWTGPDVPAMAGESAGARSGGLLGFGFAVEWGRGSARPGTGTN